MKTEILYRKVGRKYEPVSQYWRDCGNEMRVGTFRLRYASEAHGESYEYDVAPDTAGFVAAAMIAKKGMESAISEASKMRPSGGRYTNKHIAIIAKFKEDMGGMYPAWWTENSPYDIARAGVNAVRDWRPLPDRR